MPNYRTLILEKNISLEFFSIKKQRKPQGIVRPHLVKGDAVCLKPLWPHFFGFNRLSLKFIYGENIDFKNIGIVFEFEKYNTPFFEFHRRDPAFFLKFPDHSFFECFIWLNFSAKTVPASLSESNFLQT